MDHSVWFRYLFFLFEVLPPPFFAFLSTPFLRCLSSCLNNFNNPLVRKREEQRNSNIKTKKIINIIINKYFKIIKCLMIFRRVRKKRYDLHFIGVF